MALKESLSIEVISSVGSTEPMVMVYGIDFEEISTVLIKGNLLIIDEHETLLSDEIAAILSASTSVIFTDPTLQCGFRMQA